MGRSASHQTRRPRRRSPTTSGRRTSRRDPASSSGPRFRRRRALLARRRRRRLESGESRMGRKGGHESHERLERGQHINLRHGPCMLALSSSFATPHDVLTGARLTRRSRFRAYWGRRRVLSRRMCAIGTLRRASGRQERGSLLRGITSTSSDCIYSTCTIHGHASRPLRPILTLGRRCARYFTLLAAGFRITKIVSVPRSEL